MAAAKNSEAEPTLIGELKRVLIENGWSQRELARRIGVDQSRVSRVLSGHDGMSMNRVPDLARVLGRPEAEVAAIVWNSRPKPNAERPVTLTERVANLEQELADVRGEVRELTEMVERALAAGAAKKAPAKRAPRKRDARG